MARHDMILFIPNSNDEQKFLDAAIRANIPEKAIVRSVARRHPLFSLTWNDHNNLATAVRVPQAYGLRYTKLDSINADALVLLPSEAVFTFLFSL